MSEMWFEEAGKADEHFGGASVFGIAHCFELPTAGSRPLQSSLLPPELNRKGTACL